jgi:clan AA aspartic protease
MGLVYANITLSNPRLPELKPMEVTALVDTGALHLCIPEHVANQLQLIPSEYRDVSIADGSSVSCPYVGPIHARFDNRQCFVGAMVLGDEVLLGAIPMEDMDILVHPAKQQLIVNPANPNFACSKAKGFKVTLKHDSEKSE